MADITINGVTFDPAQDAHAMQAFGLLGTDTAKSDYILVQTHSPLTAAQKTELENAGARLHGYVRDAYEYEYILPF